MADAARSQQDKRFMRAALGDIVALRDGQLLLDLYETLAKAMYRTKGLHPNLDYPAGPAYHLIGFDTPAFTPIFVVARLPGALGPKRICD